MTRTRRAQDGDAAAFDRDREEALLDRAFEAAVSLFEQGCEVGWVDVAEGREDLRPQIEEVLALARQVAPIRPTSIPKVPGYVVLGEIASGAMGEVFIARQERAAGRLVALKVLPNTSAYSSRARERFRVESAAIARLGHPSIVRIFDIVEHEGIHAFAMELVDGSTLADLIREVRYSRIGQQRHPRPTRPQSRPRSRVRPRNGPWDATPRWCAGSAWRSRGPWMRSTPRDAPSGCQAVEHPHSVRWCALLTDFGLVRDVTSTVRTEPGQFVGTAAYASPEQPGRASRCPSRCVLARCHAVPRARRSTSDRGDHARRDPARDRVRAGAADPIAPDAHVRGPAHGDRESDGTRASSSVCLGWGVRGRPPEDPRASSDRGPSAEHVEAAAAGCSSKPSVDRGRSSAGWHARRPSAAVLWWVLLPRWTRHDLREAGWPPRPLPIRRVVRCGPPERSGARQQPRTPGWSGRLRSFYEQRRTEGSPRLSGLRFRRC